MEHHPDVVRICVIEYLTSIRGMEVSMRDLEHRIAELRFRLEGLSGGGGSAIRTASADRMSEGIGRLEILEEEWSTTVALYADRISEAMCICATNHMNRYICWMHWVEKLTWEQVGCRLGYSKQHARLLAESGITEIYGEMPEEYRRYSIPSSSFIKRDKRKDKQF